MNSLRPAKNRRTKAGNAPALPPAGGTITAARVATAIRTRFDPLPSLNPRLLTQYLQQFEYGYLEPAARVWDAMERRDDRLASVSAKAKSALARHGYEVLIVAGLDPTRQAEAQRHKAALEYLYGNCTATNAAREDETGGFSLLIRQMADAVGKRYSVHEIVWEPRADGRLTATFRHAPLWFFENTTGRLRFKPQDGATEGVPMDPDAWLVTVGEGIMEACSVLWMYKHLPLRDWLAFSEKFGMPYLLGKTGAPFDSREWHAMAEALRGFGSDGAAVIGGADEIVPVSVGGGADSVPYQGLVERSDRALSILWRGADLGTQSHGGVGGGQGASLQGDETSALDEDRAAWLTESLLPVSRTAVRYLFGPDAEPLAYLRVRTQPRRDIALDLAVDTFLLNHGAPMALAAVLERYGRPVPAAGETLLQARPGDAAATASEERNVAAVERAANEADGSTEAFSVACSHGTPLPCLRPPAETRQRSAVATGDQERASNEDDGKSDATCQIGAANDAAAGAGIGHADQWFQVSPYGRFPHRVGMQVFDRPAAEGIVRSFDGTRARLAQSWRGLPVFIGHPDLDPKTYPDGRKYGSIQRLEVRADGLYAQARWSRAGREIVNDEHFDFPSPLWNMEPLAHEVGAFRPVELLSVGLTNRPNIANKPVGANVDQPPTAIPSMNREILLQSLGLPAEASDEAIAAAIARLRAAEEENTRLATQLGAANEARDEHSRHAADERRARIEDRLTTAANAGRITEAERPGWRSRLETDFDGASGALGQLAPALHTRRACLTGALGERSGGTTALTRAARIQAANEAVEARLRVAGDGDYPRAFAWVRSQRPELFKDMQEPETHTA